MKITTADGQVYERPDMCGYCTITTGGFHQWNCPAFPQILKLYEVGVDTSKLEFLNMTMKVIL